MSDLDLNIDFKLNSPEAVAEAEKVRKAVKGVGDTSEDVGKRVTKSMKTTFSDSAREVEAYKKSLGDLGGVSLSPLEAFTELLNKDLKDGKINAEQLKKELEYFNSPKNFNVKTGKIESPLGGDFKNLLAQAEQSFESLDQKTKQSIGRLVEIKGELSSVGEAEKALSQALKDGGITTETYNNEQKKLYALSRDLSGALNENSQDLNKNGGATKNLRSELLATKNAMAQLYSEGKKNSAEYSELSERAGVLQNSITNVNQSIQNLGSNNASLNTLITGVEGVAGAFAAGQGFAALFGDENKDVQKTIAKVTASLAILQGVQTLSNSIQKISTLASVYLAAARTEEAAATVAASVATGVNTAAVVTNTGFVTGAIAATRTWTIALLSNPIALIAAAITLAVTALVQFINRTDEAADASERLNGQLETQNELLGDNLTAIDLATDYAQELAKKRGASESEIISIKNEGLKKQRAALLEQKKILEDDLTANDNAHEKKIKSDEIYYKDLDAITAKYKEVGNKLLYNQAKIDIGGIQVDVSKNSEVKEAAKEQKRLDKESAAVKKRADVQLASAIDARKKLNEKLGDLNNEYGGKTFTKDEEEVNALKEKFTKFKRIIQDFNNDPKNKGVAKIDVVKVDNIEKKAITQLLEKQAAAKAEITKKQKDKDFAEALKASETFEIKKKAIADKYEKLKGDLLTLPADEYVKRAAELDNALKAESDKLNDDQIKKLKTFEPLFEGFENLSRKSAKTVINSLRTILDGMVKTGDISEEYAKQIRKALDAADKSVNAKFFDGIDKAAATVGQMAGFVSEFNGQLGESLGLLATVLNSVKQVGQGIKDYQKAKDNKDVLGQIGAGLGIAGAAFAVGKAVVGYFKNLKAAAEAAKAEQKKFYDDAIKGEREYQALVRGRERESAKAQANRLAGLQKEFELLKKQGGQIDSEFTKLLSQLQKEQYVTASTYTHGTWFRKAKTENSYAGLSGMSYEQIEKLFTQGKLTDSAKALFEQLQKLKNEGGDVAQALADVAKQAAEIFTGTNADKLTESLAQMFKDGKTSAQDFADFFENAMSDAALSVFKNQILAKQMDDFYKKFAEDAQSGGGLDQSEIDNLRKLFKTANEEAKKAFDDLQAVTGLNLGGDKKDTNPNTIRGNVQNITANQADVLSGRIGSMVLSVAESNGIQREGFSKIALSGSEQLAMLKIQHLTQMEISANTLRTANNTDRLKAIEEGITKMANNNGVRAVGGP